MIFLGRRGGGGGGGGEGGNCSSPFYGRLLCMLFMFSEIEQCAKYQLSVVL